MSTGSAGTVVTVSAAPWLDDREQRAWRGYVRLEAQLLRHLNRQLQADSDLSISDYDVLVHLSEAPGGRLRVFALGQALQWEKSRLSHHLGRMERRGLVAREECDTDGRGAEVVLTRAGRSSIRAAAPQHVAEVRRVFVDRLTPEQLDVLSEIAAVVLAGLDGSDVGEAGSGNS
jgi:DNA-binding MarR family transcriptional regulator